MSDQQSTSIDLVDALRFGRFECVPRFGVGMATVRTERTPWNVPMVASLRVELTKFLVAEVEWTQPMRATTCFEITDFTPSTLDGRTGIYGHSTRLDSLNWHPRIVYRRMSPVAMVSPSAVKSRRQRRVEVNAGDREDRRPP